jgi:hypothetical protein
MTASRTYIQVSEHKGTGLETEVFLARCLLEVEQTSELTNPIIFHSEPSFHCEHQGIYGYLLVFHLKFCFIPTSGNLLISANIPL